MVLRLVCWLVRIDRRSRFDCALNGVIMLCCAKHLTLHMASLHPGTGVQTGECELTEQAEKTTEGLAAMKMGDERWVIDCSWI